MQLSQSCNKKLNFQRLCKIPTQRGITTGFSNLWCPKCGTVPNLHSRTLRSYLAVHLGSHIYSCRTFGGREGPGEGSFSAYFHRTIFCFVALVPLAPVPQYQVPLFLAGDTGLLAHLADIRPLEPKCCFPAACH